MLKIYDVYNYYKFLRSTKYDFIIILFIYCVTVLSEENTLTIKFLYTYRCIENTCYFYDFNPVSLDTYLFVVFNYFSFNILSSIRCAQP